MKAAELMDVFQKYATISQDMAQASNKLRDLLDKNGSPEAALLYNSMQARYRESMHWLADLRNLLMSSCDEALEAARKAMEDAARKTVDATAEVPGGN